MTTIDALSDICIYLLTAGSPAHGQDVIINVHGIYQFVPAWDWRPTVDRLCSLDSFTIAADQSALAEFMSGARVAGE